MTVDVEGKRLFSKAADRGAAKCLWRAILIGRLDDRIATLSFGPDDARHTAMVGDLVRACALRPLDLDASSAAWSISAVDRAGAEPRVRVAKTLGVRGDRTLLELAPRDTIIDRPCGTVSPAGLTLAATAPFATFEQAREAVEQLERRTRQLLDLQHRDIADANRDLPWIAVERLASAGSRDHAAMPVLAWRARSADPAPRLAGYC